MENKKLVGKGLDPTLFLFGLGVLLVGAGVAAIGLFTSFGLRLGPVPIPLSLVGPLIALGGLLVAFLGMRDTKCLACKESLSVVLAAFVPDAEARVIDAVRRLDAVALDALGMGAMDENNAQVSLQYCGKCQAVGLVEVTAFRDQQKTSLIASQEVSGAALPAFAQVMEARAKAHEARAGDDSSDD